jgi:hypothetical protein
MFYLCKTIQNYQNRNIPYYCISFQCIIFAKIAFFVLKKPEHRRKQGFTKKLVSDEELEGINLEKLVGEVDYKPSQKHKRYPIEGQKPYFDHNSAKCDNSVTLEQVKGWLTEAIQNKTFSSLRGTFPACIWHRVGNDVFEAKQTIPGKGEYHGFPLEEYEVPEEMKI